MVALAMRPYFSSVPTAPSWLAAQLACTGLLKKALSIVYPRALSQRTLCHTTLCRMQGAGNQLALLQLRLQQLSSQLLEGLGGGLSLAEAGTRLSTLMGWYKQVCVLGVLCGACGVALVVRCVVCRRVWHVCMHACMHAGLHKQGLCHLAQAQDGVQRGIQPRLPRAPLPPPPALTPQQLAKDQDGSGRLRGSLQGSLLESPGVGRDVHGLASGRNAMGAGWGVHGLAHGGVASQRAMTGWGGG